MTLPLAKAPFASITLLGSWGWVCFALQIESLAGLIGSALVAWLGIQFIGPKTKHAPHKRLIVSTALLLPGWILWATYHSENLVNEERWSGIALNLEDRAFLEQTPSLFPNTYYSTLPQTFYIQSKNAQSSLLTIHQHTTKGIPLGRGLFRHTFPSQANIPAAQTITATLILDGKAFERELKHVAALAHPRWFCSAPQIGQAATLSEETNQGILVQSNGSHALFATGQSPSDCLIIPHTKQLIISHRHERLLWVLDLKTLALRKKIDLGYEQHRLALSKNQDKIAIALNTKTPEIRILSTQSFKEIDRISPPTPVDWITFAGTATNLIFSSRQNQRLYRYQRDNQNWKYSFIDLGRPATVMTTNTDQSVVYLATTGFIGAREPLNDNHYIQDQILGFDTNDLKLKYRLLLPTSQKTSSASATANLEGASPLGLSFFNKTLLIALPATNSIWKITETLKPPITTIPFNKEDLFQPIGVSWLGEQSWAITSPSNGTIEIKHPHGPSIIRLTPKTSDLPAHQRRQRRGEQVFYEATKSARSCQSCHLHGDSDYSYHNLGDPDLLPTTLSVLGIGGTSPYLRQGSYNRIGLLMELLDFTFDGFEHPIPFRGEHLEAFLESRPLPINPAHLTPSNPAHLSTLQKGYDQFIKAECHRCHRPPAFTHLGKVPAKTLFPDFPNPTYSMDTPTLLGLWRSPPYLYDGRAENLYELLTVHNQHNRHGDTKNLSPEELNQLVFFLENL